ncbi:MAG: hypothetical protein HZC55_10740 [Verrucomicrobia bacterium]|nr:hypothetical protein [Verrucomicrobiota bacterium]
MALTVAAPAQIGRRFPSEKRIVPDPVTGVPLTFLTTQPAGDSKIYPTHHQWTADGKWVVFRSSRVPGQAMAVNEANGAIVQVTEGGYTGMLCLADRTMNLYFLRPTPAAEGAMVAKTGVPPAGSTAPAPATLERQGRGGPRGPMQVVRVDLARLLADSDAGNLQGAGVYEHVCGIIPTELGAGGDLAIDASEHFAYFRVAREAAARHLPPETKPEPAFGPRALGAGPTGLASMDLRTGEIRHIISVPFQIGHVQTNPWVPGEIVFCWETGGKAPQRTWTVRSDGTGLRLLYPEAPYEWVTHEAVITRDEVALAIVGHRRIDSPSEWGPAGTAEHPTGLGIVNLRTREMRIVSQVPFGDPGRSVWHVHGSPDGRWAVADDFQYRLWLTDRHTGETVLLADLGHRTTAADHLHPTFSSDSTRIEIQTAMLAEDGRSLNLCVVPVPAAWLQRSPGQRRLVGTP